MKRINILLYIMFVCIIVEYVRGREEIIGFEINGFDFFFSHTPSWVLISQISFDLYFTPLICKQVGSLYPSLGMLQVVEAGYYF